MKTNIEINGFVINVEELDGKITITAEKDGEVIDEIVLSNDESESKEETTEDTKTDLKSFDEFDKEDSTDSTETEEEESNDESTEVEEEIKDEEEIKEGLLTFDKFLNK